MILLSSESFPHYGLERFFEFTQKSGYDGVEIVINENFDTQNINYLKSLEKRFKTPIRAFSISRNNEGDFIEVFEEVLAKFPKTTINLNSPESLSFKYKKWMEKDVSDFAKHYDLLFCRRNTPFKLFLGIIPQRSENSLYALRDTGNVCLDVSALWISKEEVMKTINFLGNKLRHVYLSNVYKNIPYSPPKDGILPLESFLTKLAQIKYKGDFTLRINPKKLHEGHDKKMLEILTSSRKFYEKYFK